MTLDELPQRQRQVLELLAAGQQNKQIAAQLKLSPRTVELHRALAMRAIGARTVADAVRIWDRLQHAEPKLVDRRRSTTPIDHSKVPRNHRAPMFVAAGKQVLRDGEHFADAATPEIAHAIALAFDGAQLPFGPDVSLPDQDMVASTLWPLRDQPQGDELDELAGAEWEA